MSRVRHCGLVNTEHLACEGFCRVLVIKIDGVNSAQVSNCGQTLPAMAIMIVGMLVMGHKL